MFKMLLLIISLLAKGCICTFPITFSDDKSMINGSIQSRLGWSNLGKLGAYFNALEKILGGNLGVPIQTEIIYSTIPTTTTNRLSTFPPLPSVFSSFPTLNPGQVMEKESTTFLPPTFLSTGISTPNIAELVPRITIINPTKCECMAKELCFTKKATTRIVNRPPSGIVCSSEQAYCCINKDSKEECGATTIIPGVVPQENQAYLGEHPWTALILTNGNAYVGGGVLIDSNHVLTVAHRVAQYGNGGDLKVRLGEWDITNENEPVRHLEVKVKKIINHPKFESTTLKNDISILTLTDPVPYKSSTYPQINTICLPQATSVFSGMRCRVAGWGKDDFNGKYQNIIKEVDVPVLSSIECQTMLRSTKLGSSFVLDTNSFICAGGELNRDACTGDGGNALECLINGKYYLAGITAGGIDCGKERIPGLYVNIVNFLTWISTEIGKGNEGGLIDPRRFRR